MNVRSTVGEALSGAEAARLDQPNEHTIDDVLRVLDSQPPSARDLYYRWEHQQWEATRIDLVTDSAQWSTSGDDVKRSLRALLACMFIGQASQDALVPLADWAPLEEQQVFLTTQLVDLARHTVFVERFLEEVTEEGAVPNDPPASALTDPIVDRAGRIEASGDVDRGVFHEVLFLQSVLLEGVIGVTVAGSLCGWLEDTDSFEGLRLGLMATARDHCRHALFAIGLLEEEIARDAAVAERLQALLEGVLPLFPKIFDAAAAGSMDLSGLSFGAHDLTVDAMDALSKRMDDVGLDLPG